MPYISRTEQSSTFRLMISGFSKSGKSTSLPTFIYGPYNYSDPTQQDAAVAYADGKHMVVLSCPGETGVESLPVNTPHITSHHMVVTPDEDTRSAQWSYEAVSAFLDLNDSIVKEKPDIIAWEGIHHLYNHILNSNSKGEFLSGADMDIDPVSGKAVQYRAAKYYNRTRHNFDSIISSMCQSSVPLFIVTIGEKWEEVSTVNQRADVKNTRYLWPDLSGEMATRIVGLFDARLSARVEAHCLHNVYGGCSFTKDRVPHHVWQFLPGGDVAGVGIRGLKVTKEMQRDPWIHQNYDDLKGLMEAFT